MAFINYGVIPRSSGWEDSLSNFGANLLNTYNSMSTYYDSPEYKIAMQRLKDMQETSSAFDELRASNPNLYLGSKTGVNPLLLGSPQQASLMGELLKRGSMSPEEYEWAQAQAKSGMKMLPEQEAFHSAMYKLQPEQIQQAINKAIQENEWYPSITQQSINASKATEKYHLAEAGAAPVKAQAELIKAKAAQTVAGPHAAYYTELTNQLKGGDKNLFAQLTGSDSKLSHSLAEVDKLTNATLNNTVAGSNPLTRATAISRGWGSKLDILNTHYAELDGIKQDAVRTSAKADTISRIRTQMQEIADYGVMGIMQGDKLAVELAQRGMANGLRTLSSNPAMKGLATEITKDFDAAITKAIEAKSVPKGSYNQFSDWSDRAAASVVNPLSNILNRSLFGGYQLLSPIEDPVKLRQQTLREELLGGK